MTTIGEPLGTQERPSAMAMLRGAVRRVTEGEIGPLPVILGLIVIGAIFQSQNSNFLRPLNLTNLMVQIAAVGTISVGLVLVLLLGEIDLSVGVVSGLCAGIMAVFATKHGWSGPAAMGAGVLAGAGIGLLQGVWITKLRVPSFIVTLAGLLAWQGALLKVLGKTGTVNLTDEFITDLANRRLPVALGWIIGVLFVLAYAGGAWWSRRRRVRSSMAAPTLAAEVARVAVVAAGVLAAVAIMSVNRSPGLIAIRGVPSGVLIFIALVVVFDLIVRRTKFGRYIFAVGGNVEAARRAGINVDLIRITVFVLASTLAAFGGILAASRLFAVNQGSGSGDVLLSAVAAPVIGGTSLFGGRGNVWSALLGALVIGSISNGMDLLALESSIKFMVTGAVLLSAVTIDALARRSREAAGRS
jgi:D-xylose transport system permease protein